MADTDVDVADCYSEMKMARYFTLVFVKSNRRILLGMKRRGFGVGKWHGFGGKVESEESLRESAARELREESTLEVQSSELRYLGYVTFRNENDSDERVVYIFEAETFSGEPSETEEMIPRWFDFDQIPYRNMWPDSRHWIPWVLDGHYLKARFIYRNNDEILEAISEKLESAPEPLN